MASIYESIGGEETVWQLVERFYHHMDTLPEAQGIRKMHVEDLTLIKENLFMYLSGWLGGPPLFEEKYGHPRLRARHLPFKIGKSERDQWMVCMVYAFDDVQIQEPFRSEILHNLLNLADHMRNIPNSSA